MVDEPAFFARFADGGGAHEAVAGGLAITGILVI